MAEPKILHLTLKGKWFDMIAASFKKEEYREIKMFWWSRLVQCGQCYDSNGNLWPPEKWMMLMSKTFDVVHFARGGHFHETIPQISVECKGIEIGTGKAEWGAEPGKNYFTISLGKILSTTKQLNPD